MEDGSWGGGRGSKSENSISGANLKDIFNAYINMYI